MYKNFNATKTHFLHYPYLVLFILLVGLLHPNQIKQPAINNSVQLCFKFKIYTFYYLQDCNKTRNPGKPWIFEQNLPTSLEFKKFLHVK